MTDIGTPEESARDAESPAAVFVSDPSAEAERVAQALRASGYAVVDVPLSLLVARVAVQRPRVILVDADAEGAAETLARARETDGATRIDVLLLGRSRDTLAPGLPTESGAFFARPVDVAALLAKVDALTGGSGRTAGEVQSASIPAVRAAAPSLPPPSMRNPEPRTPESTPRTPVPRPVVPSLGVPMEPAIRRSDRSPAAPLSGELEALLAEAEQRIGGQMGQSESMLPSPEEEIEAVLPAEVLASLDEPLEDDEDDALADGSAVALHRGGTTGAGKVTTGGSTGAGSTGGGRTPDLPSRAVPRPLPTEGSLPPLTTGAGTFAGSTGSGTTGTSLTGLSVAPLTAFEGAPAPPIVEVSMTMPPMTIDDRSVAPMPRAPVVATPSAPPSVLGAVDAPRVLAAAIAARASGVLAFDAGDGVRRVALREGDVTTAASTVEEESLLPFLAARGELPRDRVAQLAGKMPPFGRHAGAALVAHGYLRQDQLWQVLRAHAEWVLGRIVGMTSGTAGFEGEPPARVKSEPGVFGASTGAEVLVEVVRRVIAPAEAVARLGGDDARVADGPKAALASECALGEAERAWLAQARGRTLADAVGSAADPDFASVLYALVLLGVCESIRPVGGGVVASARAADRAPASAVDPLDEEAIRARVRARMQLVDEGDYFAVLGVARDATSYEVKRAFLELRRVFEPARLLTPALADLRADVEKIAVVLDEAYEILRDGARRERYRRAIDAAPR